MREKLVLGSMSPVSCSTSEICDLMASVQRSIRSSAGQLGGVSWVACWRGIVLREEFGCASFVDP